MPAVSKKQQNFMQAVANSPKFADKVGGEVVSIQGQHFNGLQNECDHFDLRLDATRQFCAPKNGLR